MRHLDHVQAFESLFWFLYDFLVPDVSINFVIYCAKIQDTYGIKRSVQCDVFRGTRLMRCNLVTRRVPSVICKCAAIYPLELHPSDVQSE